MPPSRYIRLTEEEDIRLREIEQEAPYFKPKVRLRAQAPRFCASPTGAPTCKPSPHTPGAPERALVVTSTASKSEAWRDFSMERLQATRHTLPRRRGSSWSRGSARSAPGMQPSLPRLLKGAFWDRGLSRGRPPTPHLDGLLLEAHSLCAKQSAGPRGGAKGEGRPTHKVRALPIFR